VEASKQNRAKADDFIKELKPIGGTAIDDALKRALALKRGTEDRPYVVVFLTDGRPTIGTTDEDQIVAAAKKQGDGRTRVFCFGIGTDVNTHLLDRIAEETRAFSQYVLPEEDLEVKVSSFYSKIKEPVLANPTLKFTGDIRATKLYPSPLPDLFKGEQLVLVGRYSGKGDSAVTVEGSVNGSAKKFTYEVRFPEESSENDFIPRLWATRRVGYLLDEIRLHGENGELREEVTELARKYGIVTPYTAYLIMEDETHRDVPMSQRSLYRLGEDSAAREESARVWHDFKMQTDGDKAVADSLSGNYLKMANAPAQALAGGEAAFQRRYGFSGNAGVVTAAKPTSPALILAPDSAQGRLVQYARQSQFVGGKNFFQNDKQWIDSAVQKYPNAKRMEIKFGSPEYFDFVAKNPNSLPWLSLGQNVEFVLEKTVYVVRE